MVVAFGASMDVRGDVDACDATCSTPSVCSEESSSSATAPEWRASSFRGEVGVEDSDASATDTEREAETRPFPRLLGRERLLKASAVPFEVKNTFISVDTDEDEDGDEEFGVMPMVKSLTWSGRARAFDGTPVGGAAPPKLASLEQTASDEIVPLEGRRPEESVGSSLHASQRCKPCCWYWRPQGCSFGKACRHCHTCPSGELKRRRVAKKILRRAAAEQAESAGSAGATMLGANAIVFAVPALAFVRA